MPVACVFAYIAHRRAGPAIKWRYGKYWGGVVAVVVGGMAAVHYVDPQTFGREGPKEGMRYFFPSEARTADGNFIPERVLMMDEYCVKCHQDIYNDHLHSAHKFSSFNNPAYLFSVRETRKVALERDGKVNASRWCAGCHDPVPFFSGEFDDPNFDIVNHPTAHAGITCTVCHAMTHVNSPIGNAAFTIEEPQHYPFAFSENPTLQWINNQLIKAKPDFHKKTFLKPFHKTAEFCSTCHKVCLPVELNHYKDFLRGQNHYDTFLLSGVGPRLAQLLLPAEGQERELRRRATCRSSRAATSAPRTSTAPGVRKRHIAPLPRREHRAASSCSSTRTALQGPASRSSRRRSTSTPTSSAAPRPTAATRSSASTSSAMQAVRPAKADRASTTRVSPCCGRRCRSSTPGKSYLVEVVVRTLNIGHPFTQGTADSNEIWVDFKADGGRQESSPATGALAGPDDTGQVDPWSHFVNVLMLDRHGNRIDRRNPQDIFTPLYDKQIPPGAGQVVHYRLDVPKDVTRPGRTDRALRYRKFDYEYMKLVHKEAGKPVPKLPIVDMCEDRVTLPVAGVAETVPAQESPIKPAWQRWNDYGIGCLLEGGARTKRGNLRQAEAAFTEAADARARRTRCRTATSTSPASTSTRAAWTEATRELERGRQATRPRRGGCSRGSRGSSTARTRRREDLDAAIGALREDRRPGQPAAARGRQAQVRLHEGLRRPANSAARSTSAAPSKRRTRPPSGTSCDGGQRVRARARRSTRRTSTLTTGSTSATSGSATAPPSPRRPASP